MSIEKALADLTEALNANTAALLKSGGTASAATAEPEAATTAPKKGPGRPAKTDAPAATKAPVITQEQMVAALEELKDKKSLDAAKKVITEAGGVDKRKDIPADKYAAVYEAAKTALKPEPEAEEEEGM